VGPEQLDLYPLHTQRIMLCRVHTREACRLHASLYEGCSTSVRSLCIRAYEACIPA